MKNKVLLVILVMSLVCAWGGVGTAGQIGYSMRGSEVGFGFKPNPNPPSSAVVAADAILGRPLVWVRISGGARRTGGLHIPVWSGREE